MEQKNKIITKKRVFAIVVILCIAVITVSVIKQCSTAEQNRNTLVYSYDPFDYKSDVGYYEPAEGENIFDDEEYLEKNRYMSVEYQGTTMTYTEKEIDNAPDSVFMLYEYFNAAMNGDGKTLNTFFTDYYFNNFGDTIAKFDDTIYQQKIYNIKVRLESGPVSVAEISGTVTREIFEVSYYIMDNNGAFRPDLPEPEDGTIPLFFEILTDSDGAKINQIFVYSE